MNNIIKKFNILIFLVLIISIAFIAYLPCIKNGFVNWDDNIYVVQNNMIRFFDWGNVKGIFTSSFFGNYQPIAILSYLFEYRFFKLNPAVYHMTNLLLHLLNCALVFMLIYKIGRSVFIAFITAVLFGIHPLQVETVVWVSERKGLLSAFFLFSSIICYMKYLDNLRQKKYYFFSLSLFILSLLSKPLSVMLPLVLLVIDYFIYRRCGKNLYIDKVPFFVLSLTVATISIYAQYHLGAVRAEGLFMFFDKIILAFYCIGFYLTKIFIPIKLSCLYPYPNIFNRIVPIILIIIAILIICIIWLRKRLRKVAFSSALFLIMLLPALQFFPVSGAVVADRYIYPLSLDIFYCCRGFCSVLL